MGTTATPQHAFLVLPFTHSVLKDPVPLLPTVYNTLLHLPPSVKQLIVAFTSPPLYPAQLYNLLRQDPRRYWQTFQTFLGDVYATLAAAQWRSDRVLMDVEVQFARDDRPVESILDLRPGAMSLIAGGQLSFNTAGRADPEGVLAATSALHSAPNVTVISLPVPVDEPPETAVPRPGPPVVALGGTFDHLHAAHKLLLQLAVFLSTRKVIVGITAPSLLVGKSHADLVESLEERTRGVQDFLERCDGGVELVLREIHDPLGPTAWDPDIQTLVVSRETISGGEAVNRARKDKGLSELELWIVDVIASTLQQDHHGAAEAEQEGEGNHVAETLIKTTDLRNEMDEKKLKELKMGSTGIREWIAEQRRARLS